MDYLIQVVYLTVAAGTGWLVGYQTGWVSSESRTKQAKAESIRSAREACEGLNEFISEMDSFVKQSKDRNRLLNTSDCPARSRSGE